MSKVRIAIIGAGPGGLSLARLLKEKGVRDVTVFEARDRVGGKAASLSLPGGIIEMGTCYTTLDHGIVKRWMREQGIRQRQIGPARFDGRAFLDYVREGEGPAFVRQASRFFGYNQSVRRRLRAERLDRALLEETARPLLEWIEDKKLPKVERLLHRVQTAQGYGYLDDTSVFQSMRWINLKLVLSGALNQMHLPDRGWSTFWRHLAKDLHVRTNCPVRAVSRGPAGIEVDAGGETAVFDRLVCAIPVDDFCAMTEPTAAERDVAAGVEWVGYATSLIAAENWHTEWTIDAYSEALSPGAAPGRLIGGRYEGHEPELGGHLYVTGQIARGLAEPELREALRADLGARGIRLVNLVDLRRWKYFPRYRPEAVREGLPNTMRAMQGEAGTFYTGATFSHELVSSIVNFNAVLAERIAREAGAGA